MNERAKTDPFLPKRYRIKFGKTQKLKDHIQYFIHVEDRKRNEKWIIVSRYKRMYAIFERLQSVYPGQLYKFPTKWKPFWGNRTEFISRRKQDLNNFFAFVLMHEKIYKLKPIKEFLMANRNNVEIIDKEIY